MSHPRKELKVCYYYQPLLLEAIKVASQKGIESELLPAVIIGEGASVASQKGIESFIPLPPNGDGRMSHPRKELKALFGLRAGLRNVGVASQKGIERG